MDWSTKMVCIDITFNYSRILIELYSNTFCFFFKIVKIPFFSIILTFIFLSYNSKATSTQSSRKLRRVHLFLQGLKSDRPTVVNIPNFTQTHLKDVKIGSCKSSKHFWKKGEVWIKFIAIPSSPSTSFSNLWSRTRENRGRCSMTTGARYWRVLHPPPEMYKPGGEVLERTSDRTL